MKKQRLYDFSAGLLVLFFLTFGILFAITGYQLFTMENKVLPAVFFSVFLAGFAALIVRFGFFAAWTDGEKIVSGKLEIAKENARFKAQYDYRFSESIILILKKDVSYLGMSKKELAKQSVKVQATERNLRILGEFFGETITAVKREKKGFFRKRKGTGQ